MRVEMEKGFLGIFTCLLVLKFLAETSVGLTTLENILELYE